MFLNYRISLILIFVIFFLTNKIAAQNFTTGADLSYINTILSKGGEYRNENGEIVNPYDYFAHRGAKMVRLRLWHTPENILDVCGNPITSSNLNDVLLAAQKTHNNGMSLNLSIHYGDYFNDPGKQLMPEAWTGLTHQVLLDSIYQYTYHVLEMLFVQNTIPEIVSIGNETTNGFIDESIPTNGFSWPEDADKFNAGLDAVDDFNEAYNQSVLKAVHLTEKTAKWLMGEFINHGISNFEVIGISYYPVFSPDISLEDVGELFKDLINDYDKDVMLFETGFIWTHENADNYNNFIGNNGNTLNYPISAQGQKDFLIDLSQVISDNGGMGVLYWEPGWVTSEMCDNWGQGSSYENAGFFDFNNQNTPLPAFDFFQFEDTLSINQIRLQDQIKVSPNPFNNSTTITYELIQPNKITITIFDISGKPIISFTQNQSNGIHKFIWDAEGFNKGLYYYILQIKNQLVFGKLLKAY